MTETSTALMKPATKTDTHRILYSNKHPLGNGITFVVEYPPIEVITSEDRSLYEVPLPWMYYIVNLRSRDMSGDFAYCVDKTRDTYGRVCSAYGRPAKWSKKTDELYYMPLPNFYTSSMTFCGNSQITSSKYSIDDQLDQVIAQFWCKFTYWTTPAQESKYSKVFREAGGNFCKWERLTPAEILKFPWGKESVGTLEEIIQSPNFGSTGWHR